MKNKILEAYKSNCVSEAISNYVQIKNSEERPIGKVLDSIGKTVDLPIKGIFYKEAPIDALNLSDEYKNFQKVIGSAGIGLAIIRDTKSTKFQIILYRTWSRQYEGGSLFLKLNNYREIEYALKEYETKLKPRPSASDVNSASRFRNGRL